MPSLPPPDADAVFVALLTAEFPTATVATIVPAGLAAAVPVIQPLRIGGPGSLVLERPTFDLNVYDLTPESGGDATGWAIQVQDFLAHRAGGSVVTYGTRKAVIADIRCVGGPSWRPYDNPNVQRVGATYTAVLQPAL